MKRNLPTVDRSASEMLEPAMISSVVMAKMSMKAAKRPLGRLRGGWEEYVRE
jgi:hypothetical protein